MYDASEALEDPQAKHLELLVRARHPTMGEYRTVRSPISYNGERPLTIVGPEAEADTIRCSRTAIFHR